MKKFVKVIALFVCAALLAASLTACGGTASNSSTTGTTGAAASLKIGVIQYATHPSLDNCYTGFVEGLKAAGYEEGVNLSIDFQNAQGSSETAATIAQSMAAKNYGLVMAIATPAATAAFAALQGKATPLLFCAVSDPVSAQLVQSLDAPGTNCTGTTDLLNLDGQLKMIKALQPTATKIGILYNTAEANSVSQLSQMQALAPQYGMEIIAQGVQSGADVAQAATTVATKVDCFNNFTDNMVVDNLGSLLGAANQAGVPVYGSEIEQVKNGCLASETLDYIALGKTTGEMGAKLLKGESAATMAVQRVKDSQPVINDTVAKTLNITVPADYAGAERV